jgi:uncharacterized protein (TIGR02996 family)
MTTKPKPAFPDPAARLPGEADILANVLSDLSDDHAKLVYADWLEERDDPRGPLLREFLQAYRAGEKLPALEPAPKVWRELIGLPLMAGMRGTTLEPLADRVLALVWPAIGIDYKRAQERTFPVGASKFGGRPDLPPDAEWPMTYEEPLTFLAQFNLSELHASPVARALPATGLLSLFCYHDYDENFDDRDWRLLYHPDVSGLVRREQPPDLPEGHYAACTRLIFTETPTLPHTDSPRGKELMRALRATDPDGIAYDNLCDGVNGMHGGDHLLGHPWTYEGDVLGKKSARLLLYITESAINGWWPEDNLMYVTISETDLRTCRFDRARATIQVV